MILARAPLRVSLFGGGTDVPAYYENAVSGATVSFAIDKYVYVSLMHTPKKHVKVTYSQQEDVPHVNDVKHDIIREALKFHGMEDHVEVTVFADIPTVGSGLGGSSALTCALLAALDRYTDYRYSKRDIADLACHIEIDLCGRKIGKQDQYASAFGGMNFIRYERSGITVEDIMPKYNDNFFDHFCLIPVSGIDRKAHEIINGINFVARQPELDMLASIAMGMKRHCNSNNISLVGQMLDMSWKHKKTLEPNITNDIIEAKMKEISKMEGFLGGKLLGAGGSGYILACFDTPENVWKINNEDWENSYMITPSLKGAEVVYES